METPYRERLRTLSRHWVEYGFGAPKITMVIYIAKLVVLYALGGIAVCTLTSHLNPLHPSAWFFAPIVYQKMVLWTVLLECVGVAGSWGPLAGHFKPMTGGWHYWARPGTIRLAPWPARVPFTGGDSRTVGDVLLYFGLLASLVAALALPGTHSGTTGTIRVASGSVIPVIALLVGSGPPRQGVLPRRSERAVPAADGLLRLLPVRGHDRGREAPDRHGVGRRRRLEVRPAFRQRGPSDGQQHPVAALEADQADVLPGVPGGPSSVPAGEAHGTWPGGVRRAGSPVRAPLLVRTMP